MKKSPWFKVLEDVSLLGSGVGAVASIVLNQASFAVAPLTLALALGALNRNREDLTDQEQEAALADLNQRLASEVGLLKQQVDAMPAPEFIHQAQQGMLSKNQELAEQLYAEIAKVQQEVHQRLVPLERQEFEVFRQDLTFLSERYSLLSEGFAHLHTELSQQSNPTRVDQLEALINQLRVEITDVQATLETLSSQTRPNLALMQEQVARLDRQFGKLPPPVDVGAMRQEVSELVKVIADLVPRRDVAALANDVQDLQRQQEKLRESLFAIETAALTLKRALHQSGAQTNSGTEAEGAQAADLTATGDISIYPELQELAVNYLSHVRSQLETVQTVTQGLAKQHKQLREQMHQLPQTLDGVSIQRQLTELSQRIPSTETALEGFKSQVQSVIQQELQYLNHHLQTLPGAAGSELVFDFPVPTAHSRNTSASGDTALLTEALQTTQERLILIWPWSNQSSLDEVLIQKFEAFLEQNRRLDLGWCHIAERDENRFLGKMMRGWMKSSRHQGDLQQTLRLLLYLKRSYPDTFQFKVLGTNENFLVSDNTFAILGIADTLYPTTSFPELQLKLRTRESAVVQRLVQRYDAPNLEADNLTAYWNRAVTRYDLGDKVGAIADFTHILNSSPDDAVVYNYRGLAYYDCGDLKAAIEDFTESLQLNPDQVAAYCNRAFIRAEQGDRVGAIRDYSLAIQAQPDCALAYFYRGMTWQKFANSQEAISDYTEAVYLAPDSAVAHYYRGLAWQKVDNLQGAITDLKAAAHLFNQRGSKTNAQKALKHLAILQEQFESGVPLASRPSFAPSSPNLSRSAPTESDSVMNFLQEISNWVSSNGSTPAAPTIVQEAALGAVKNGHGNGHPSSALPATAIDSEE